MAKRKRASLKDKSPESLGLTQKKGKGIDILFGGPADMQEPEAAAEADPMSVAGQGSSTAENMSAGDAISDGRAVDELGLPVALEAPPDDLILASAPAEPTLDGGAGDPVDPATSPFATPVAGSSQAGSGSDDVNDFTGIFEEHKEGGLSSSTRENDMSVSFEKGASPDVAAAGDLSGMVEEDMTGLIIEESPADTSGLESGPGDVSMAPPPAPAAFPPPAPPPTTAAPINVPPVTTGYAPGSATAAVPAAATAAAEKARLEIDSFSGIATEKGPISEKDILPEDALTETGDHILAVEKRSQLERDEALSEKVLRYIGRERREKLDQEIEELYSRVAEELSDSKEDSGFALRTLSDAQDIVLEDPRQYDEALYRVAVVKTMLVRKRNLRRWSYTWGMVVFFYAVVWLAAFIAGFFLPFAQADPSAAEFSQGIVALRAAWLSSLAGGIGGTIAILYSLSWRVAIKHEFDRQYIMKYLVQPIMGFILGALIFFITTAGFLFFGGGDRLLTTSSEGAFLGVSQLVALQILLGFIAGFRQRVVYYIIDRIVKRLSPTPTESREPTSVVPNEDFQQLHSAPEISSQ
ncbi:MAG: hypothetical protein OES12_04270 [Anaerolineae bacterium]|nr:hypothetical protein [Anaerolineae bacterium]